MSHAGAGQGPGHTAGAATSIETDRGVVDMTEGPSRTEIRLLSALSVRRADGTHVGVREWRTGKTMDLLRLLALDAGHPVSASSLLDKLWPQSPLPRARASLRTAASQIRGAIGTNCVERSLGGLTLTGVWVDVIAFRDMTRLSEQCIQLRAHDEVVARAREAEALYTQDFHAYDDDSAWAIGTRAALARARLTVLVNGAESAAELHLDHEAVHFAGLAVDADPCSERAHRALMLAHAHLGEVNSALRTYERYRSNLRDELGADPSPQTRELHLRLLRGSAS